MISRRNTHKHNYNLKLPRNIFFIIVVAISFMIAGCNYGITSKKPILSKGESDAIEGMAGYWIYQKDKNKDKPYSEPSMAVLVEDKSSDTLLSKDYLYNLTLFTIDSEEKTISGDPIELRAKKSKNGYIIQACPDSKKLGSESESLCIYSYARRSDDKFFITPLLNKSLTPQIKSTLGIAYIKSENKNDIKLPDDYINNQGKRLIQAIIESDINRYGLTNNEDDIFFLNKASLNEVELFLASEKEKIKLNKELQSKKQEIERLHEVERKKNRQNEEEISRLRAEAATAKQQVQQQQAEQQQRTTDRRGEVASAASVGDKVYVIFGSGSSAEVKSGTVIVAGDSRSKVEWDYCSTCDAWVYNSSFYSSRSSAQEIVNKMDSEHTSVGEAAGAAVGVGILGILSSMVCANKHPQGCTLDGKPCPPAGCK